MATVGLDVGQRRRAAAVAAFPPLDGPCVADLGLGLGRAGRRPRRRLGPRVVISDCHFRKTGTEYGRKPGIKWVSCTEK